MTPSNKFVANQRLKLPWKYLKHGIGVAFMVSPREGYRSPKHSRAIGSNDRELFMGYLESTRKS